MQHVDYLLSGKGECLVSLADLDHPLLECRNIARAPLVAAMAQEHPLAARAVLHPEDFAEVDIIGFEHDGPHFEAIGQFFANQATRPREIAYIRFADAGIALAREGVGVALLDGFTTAGTLPDGLALRPLQAAPLFTARLYWNGERPGSRFVKAFGDALIRAAALYEELIPITEQTP
jgi:DNA-binding transcriptional LysR family regulator